MIFEVLCRYILMSFEAYESDSSSDLSDSEASETDTDKSNFEELHMLPVNCIRADVPRTENFFEGIVPSSAVLA